MDFIAHVKQKAKALNKSILFPETNDERTLRALEIILKEKICRPVLLGKEQEIQQQCEKLGLSINWKEVTIVDPQNPALLEQFSKALAELRKKKGVTPESAREILKDINYFAVMMVQQNQVDGLVTGAAVSSKATLKPALQIIKTKEKFHKVSGIFFMILENRLLLFADCAVNVDPNSHDLADIALDTAETARRFGIEPRIAMLSFSTCGSAEHPNIDKIREAVALIRDQNPKLIVDGEMQVDAALVPEIAQKKCPRALIQGDANILIFPDLQSGNIAYKLVERLAKAHAIGPILQGLKKPVNDLSRGCSVEDIVALAAFTACEAQELDYELNQDTP